MKTCPFWAIAYFLATEAPPEGPVCRGAECALWVTEHAGAVDCSHCGLVKS